MLNQLLWASIFLVGSAVTIKSVALGKLSADFDFYNAYNNPEAHINLKERHTTRDRIAAHGYPAEHHHVVTDDGYVVGIFRIPYSHKLQNKNHIRPIVLIQHGLMSCSDAWVLCGPNDALPYLLADAGFDVWLGNARGNTYSKNHTKLSLKHPYFWRFSWHEIGLYDIAAMIDYALKTNGQGQQSIHYVGHSQGTTVFFTLMSLRPEYNAKIKTAHMLAPIGIMKNLENKLVRSVAPYLGHESTYSLIFSDQEFLPYNSFLLALFFNACELNSMLRPQCVNSVNNIFSSVRINKTATPDLLATHPSGCSTNQMLHYLQEQQSGHFRLFDYGHKKNLKLYKSEQPPDYPVEKITSKLHLWYSDNDNLAAVEDVLTLAQRLPNRELHHMEDPLWNHGDYAFNTETRKYINEPIIEIMKKFEENNGV